MGEKTREQYDFEIERAEAKLADARAQLMKIPGVNDVVVGIKVTGGRATDQVVYQVYVEKKKPVADLAPSDRIPTEIGGILTDVISLGPIVSHNLVCGGVRITQSLWGGSSGTLGAIGLATAANARVAPGTPLFLTNHHVASTIGGAVGVNCLCDSWCCECCAIGHLVDAQLTNLADGAIGTLNPGVPFSNDILEIGAIRGTGVAAQGMVVIKYGDTTGFTEGTVISINTAFTRTDDHNSFINQIAVQPNAPFKAMDDHGDSGSVLIDPKTRNIVGLIHSGQTPPLLALGSRIADVQAALNIDFPVMGTAGSIPLAGLGIAERPSVTDGLVTLRRDLEQTEFGKRWLEVVHIHEAEVRRLVNTDRATKVAWQRCQGPAFLSHFLKSARESTHRVPREIVGTRVENAIVTMAAVLQQHGSQELRRAVAEHYLTALECAQKAESAAEAVANMRRLAGVKREPNG